MTQCPITQCSAVNSTTGLCSPTRGELVGARLAHSLYGRAELDAWLVVLEWRTNGAAT